MILQVAIAVIYLLVGLFYSLTGFGIIKPFKNNLRRMENLKKYESFYRYGGLVIIAYGIYKMYQLSVYL